MFSAFVFLPSALLVGSVTENPDVGYGSLPVELSSSVFPSHDHTAGYEEDICGPRSS